MTQPNWDDEKGWVDAAALGPKFDLISPAQVGIPVFTLLGGYNPANSDQTLLYDALRSNYGVTLDLPHANTTGKTQFASAGSKSSSTGQRRSTSHLMRATV